MRRFLQFVVALSLLCPLLHAASCSQQVTVSGSAVLSGQLTCGTVTNPRASEPTFSPVGGSYGPSQSVAISAATGSVICWNTTGSPATNGSTGCTTGTLYTGAITVSSSETLYAVAGGTGFSDSVIGSATYTINGSAATPTFSPGAGSYGPAQSVVITATSGSVICWNTTGSPETNGSTGCTTGTLYSGAITVSSSETLYAVAGGTGYSDSSVGSAAYTINGSVSAPSFSPGAGTYSSAQTVTVTSATSGTTICYTTDNSTPAASTPGTCSAGTTLTNGGSVTVSSSLTLKALATKSGYSNSSVTSAAYTISGGGGTATLVLCPNAGETGDYATCQQPATLAFGNQGINTASMAVPVSFNNCSSAYISSCTGTGSDTISAAAISGTNASDFTISGTSTGTVASGAYLSPTITFTPTASSGTNETATLTVTDSSGTHTMTLTGTSATVTTLSSSSCPTALTGGTKYQLTANISCGLEAFTYTSGAVDLNLNGYTITYGTTTSASQAAGVIEVGNEGTLTVHNGTITQGSGTNSYNSGGSQPPTGPVTVASGDSQGAITAFNLTLTINQQYSNDIYIDAAALVAHDNIVNNTGVGTCGSVGCRENLQSTDIYQNDAVDTTSGTTNYYNNTINGGPQGGMVADAPGATINYNYVNPGNITGTNTNNFAIYLWGTNQTAEYNIILLPLTSSSATRGISIDDAEGRGTSGKLAQYNYIGAYALANSTEYSGCALGGAYGVQFDDNPQGTNTSQYNTVVGNAGVCAGAGLRVTESELTTNISEQNKLYGTRISGATACVNAEWSEAKPGCAFAMSMDGPTAFTSENDTFTGDSGDLFVGPDGAAGVTVQSPTFNEGSNPSNFHTFTAQNGPSSPVTVHVVDATFNTGTSPTDAFIYAQNSDVGPASYYIDWTQSMTVTKASGPAASGALVTFTDTLSNTYTCTTNSSGQCSVVVTQYRDNNDSGASQIENRNPYSLSVSLSGCTTNSSSGLTINAKTSRPITLSGC